MNPSERSHGLDLWYFFFRVSWRLQIAGGISGSAGPRRQRRKIPAVLIAVSLIASAATVLLLASFQQASAAAPADPVATITGIRMETQIGTVGAGAIDASATSLPVTELADVWGSISVPSSFDIYVDNERMTVTARNSCPGISCTYTVTRSVSSTTAADHLADAVVTRVWTSTPYLVNANKAFGVKVSADVGVTLTNGDESSATSGGTEWVSTSDSFVDGGCTAKLNPEVKTWTITRTTFTNPEVQVALDGNSLGAWQAASSPYKFSDTILENELIEGSNTIGIIAKARADKTVTTYSVKEYRFKNGSGTPACYPASNTSTAWSAVPESYITGTDANEVEWVTLTNFDSGSSQNEIQKILIAGLDPGVASRNEIQEIDISGFGNGDEYWITFNSTTSTLWLKNTGGSGNACPSAPTSCRALTTTNLDEVIESVTGAGTITVNSAANNGFNVTFGGSKAATDVPRIGISVKTDSGGALTGTYDTANSVDGLAAVAAEFFSLTYGGETRNFTHSSNASVTAIDAFLEEKFTTDGTDDEFTVTENSANAAIDGSETSADFRIEFTGLLTGQNVSDSAIVVACSGCTSSSISTVQDGQSGVTDSFTLTYNGSNGATFTYGSNATAAAIDTWIEGAESDADPDFTVTGADNVGPFLIRYDGFPGVNIAGPRVAQSACSGCTATVATVRDGAISSGPTVTFDVEQSTNSGTGATGNTTRVVAGFVVTRDTIAPTLNKAEFQTGGDVATQGGLALFDFESTEGVHTSVITGSSGDIRVDAFLIDEENQAASTPTFSAQIVTDSLFGNPKVGDTGKMSINDARLPVPCNAPVGEYFVKATLFDTFDLLGNRFTTGSTKDVGLLTVTSGDALTTTTGFWGVNGDGTYFELVDGFQATKNKGNKRITTSPGTLHSTALLNIAGRCTDENPSVSFAHKTDEQQRVKLNGFNAGDSFTVSLNNQDDALVTFANLSSSTGGEAEIESALELIDPGYGEGALEVEVDDISSSGFTVTFVGSHGEFDVPDLIELTNLVGVTTSPTVEVRKGGMNTFDMTLEAPPGFHFEKTGQYFAKVVAGRLLDGVPFSYTSPRLQNPWGCPGSNALDIAQPCNSDVTSRLIAATNGVNTGTFAASNPPALNEVAGSDATVYDPASNSYDKSTGWESIAPLADERQEIVLTGLTVSSTLTITVNGVSTGSLNALNTSNSDIETALETARPGSNVTVSGVEPDVGATSRTFEILFGDGDSVIETYYEGTDIDTTVAVGVAGSAVVNELTRGHGELLRIRLDGLNYEGGSANAFDVPADWDVFARVRVRYGGDWTAGYSEIPVACQQFRVLSSSHFDRYDETNPFESATDLDTYNFRYAPGGPLISTSILDPATVGSPYSFTLAGTKGTTWTVSGLPDGLSDLNGVISGTPLITARGVHEITVTFTGTGSCGSVTKTLALSVGIVKITPDSLSDATVGETYSEQIGVTGDVDVTSIGTLVADVSDSDTSITVTESTPPPVVPFDIFIGDEQMRVTARTLDSGSNYLYTVTRGVDGTTAAAHLADAKVRYYSWSLAPGYSLPDGLNLGPDGVVSGTPAEGSEGDYMFTVQVIDSAGNGTSATVSLTINPTPP